MSEFEPDPESIIEYMNPEAKDRKLPACPRPHLTPEIRAVVEAAKALVRWWSDAEYSDEMDEQPMKLVDAVLALRRAEEKVGDVK